MTLLYILVPVLTLTTLIGFVEVLVWRRKAAQLEAELIAAWEEIDRNNAREYQTRIKWLKAERAKEQYERECDL
jgi:hypothetical protein